MEDLTRTIESLLSARLHLSPQLVGDRLYFLSNRSGRMSLYSMQRGGSNIRQLIPDHIAMPNPALVEGQVFVVVPQLDRIYLTLDADGDEHYQPHAIPLAGGEPEPVWPDRFPGTQVYFEADPDTGIASLLVAPLEDPIMTSYVTDLATLELISLGESRYGNFVIGHNGDFSRLALADGYTAGDTVLFLWERGVEGRRLLAGTELADRNGAQVTLTGFGDAHVRDDGVLVTTTLFDDGGGLAVVPLQGGAPARIAIEGTTHDGAGELTHLGHLDGDRYELAYNIDGCSYGYVARFDPAARRMRIDRSIWGHGPLADGVVQAARYDRATGQWALAFSTATAPVQLFTTDGTAVEQHTNEEIDGVPAASMAAGEDASYVSHDGTRVSARLYLPAGGGEDQPHPVIYYIHGGPQSQERPDFTWFSMPLIQLFTLRGFAVFVPNVRGSSGYGLDYMKQVDRDWGGADRLDHVAAVEILRADERLDAGRLGVMGRSYGGYMTLTLLGRHPELWAAGVDMFGPYDLYSFMEALPETWKTYFYLSIGHPEHDRDLLVDRSPKTHLDALAAPMLVIQGRNDPRVVVGESDTLVADLRNKGKDIEYLVFDDEGHDMVKHANRVKAYAAIVEFFERRLG